MNMQLTWSWLETVELKNMGPKRKSSQLITALAKAKKKCNQIKSKHYYNYYCFWVRNELLIVDEEGLIQADNLFFLLFICFSPFLAHLSLHKNQIYLSDSTNIFVQFNR